MTSKPNARTLEWLYAELPALVAAGLVSPEGAEGIKERYGVPERRSAASVAVIGLSALGASFIIGGVILLLGSNWEELTRGMRAVIAFIPLLIGQGLAGYTLLRRFDSTAWRESSALFLTGAIGASIALIGQTYHLPGSLESFLTIWMILAWPLIYLLNASTVAVLAMAAALGWAAETDNTWKPFYIWLFLAGLLPHLALACRANPRGLRFQFLSWCFVAYLCLMPLAFNMYPGFSGWLGGYAGLFGVLLLFGLTPAAGPWGNPYSLIGGAATAVFAIAITFPDLWEGLARNATDRLDSQYVFMLLPFVLWLATRLLYFGLLAYHIVNRQRLPVLWGALPLLVIGSMWLLPRGLSPDIVVLLSYAYVLILSIATIREGVASGAVGLTNIGMGMMAAFAAVRFFDLDLPFVVRGVLFICIGVAFLAGNIYLARRMKKGTV